MIAMVLAILLSLLIAVIVYFAISNGKPAVISEDSKPIDERSLSTSIVKENQSVPADSLVESNNSHPISAQPSTPQENKTTKPPSVRQTADPIINNENSSIETVDNRQQDQLEYKLKQTEEYQQLDANIDKESEQLSELINEVKKRNQSQIQQHQLPQPNTSYTYTNDSASIPQVEYDYPITPITALPADSSKTTTASANTDR